MPTKIKKEPTLVRPNGSHSLSLNKQSYHQTGETFEREELYPIAELDAPRVGTVRATFSVDRYVHSSGWSDWRIYLRDVRTPDPERPDLPHLGREAAGIGPATRTAIADACAPLIRAWLDSGAYAASRRRAAAYAIRRELDAPRDYQLSRVRETLARAREDLSPMEADHLSTVLDLLDRAATELQREPISH